MPRTLGVLPVQSSSWSQRPETETRRKDEKGQVGNTTNLYCSPSDPVSLISDPSGDPGNTKQHTRIEFWSRLWEGFVGRLLHNVKDGSMGLLEQISAQERLHSLSPCGQSRSSLQQWITNSHDLQGQGWESCGDTEAQVSGASVWSFPQPLCAIQGCVDSLGAQEHQDELPLRREASQSSSIRSARNSPCDTGKTPRFL